MGFYPHRIREILDAGEFEPVPVLRTWADRGWLRVSPERRYYRTRINGVSEDLVAITREAIDQLMGDEPLPPLPPRAPRGDLRSGPRSETHSQ